MTGVPDNTAEILAEYAAKDSRIQFHHRPPEHKPGGNGARNYGFLLSKGDYINWFDSDDVMHPEKLERQLSGLQKTLWNFSVCRAAQFEENIHQNTLPFTEIVSQNPLQDFITHRIKFMTPAPIFKKEFLLKNKLSFNENLKASQEWDFFVRVLKTESDYHTDPEVLVFYRKHPESISHAEERVKQKERLRHYFSARFEILKNETTDKEIRLLLESELLRVYKKSLKLKLFSESEHIYRKFVLTSQLSPKKKFYAGSAWLSFLIFKKGELFLKRF